jgi:hypothetical protein
MRWWLVVAVWLGVFGIFGGMAGRAAAQEVPCGAGPAHQVLPVPVYQPMGPTTWVIPAPDKEPQPIRDCLRHCGLFCWSHVDCLGCGSLHSEARFMFGSCHDFFDQPCSRGAPPIPYPWYGGDGVGVGAGVGGCNCH